MAMPKVLLSNISLPYCCSQPVMTMGFQRRQRDQIDHRSNGAGSVGDPLLIGNATASDVTNRRRVVLRFSHSSRLGPLCACRSQHSAGSGCHAWLYVYLTPPITKPVVLVTLPHSRMPSSPPEWAQAESRSRRAFPF